MLFHTNARTHACILDVFFLFFTRNIGENCTSPKLIRQFVRIMTNQDFSSQNIKFEFNSRLNFSFQGYFVISLQDNSVYGAVNTVISIPARLSVDSHIYGTE